MKKNILPVRVAFACLAIHKCWLWKCIITYPTTATPKTTEHNGCLTKEHEKGINLNCLCKNTTVTILHFSFLFPSSLSKYLCILVERWESNLTAAPIGKMFSPLPAFSRTLHTILKVCIIIWNAILKTWIFWELFSSNGRPTPPNENWG